MMQLLGRFAEFLAAGVCQGADPVPVEKEHSLADCSGNLAGLLPILKLTRLQAGVAAGVTVAGLENHKSAAIR